MASSKRYVVSDGQGALQTTSSNGPYVATYEEMSAQNSERVSEGEGKYDVTHLFEKNVIYADRPAYERRSNNLLRESWSYHSLFPSLRTFAPLFFLPLCILLMRMSGIPFPQEYAQGMFELFMAIPIVGAIFFILEATKARVSHIVKDSLIVIVLVMFLLFRGLFQSSPEIILTYMGAHLLMHGIDFHLERSKDRFLMLTLMGFVVCFFLLLLVSYLTAQLM